MDLIGHFKQELSRGHKLCVMPVPRTLIERHIVETGNVARQGLSLLTQALESNYLSSKFAQCFVALEFLASPGEPERMRSAKPKIGAHVARSTTAHHDFSKRFRYLHHDVRTKLVHGGLSLEQVIPDRGERTKIFGRLQSWIGIVISDLIAHATVPWKDMEAWREARLHELGVRDG